MPEASAEIERILRDFVDAIASSNGDEIERRTSRDSCAVAIGSDPNEWTEGYDRIMQLMRESTPEGEVGITAGLDDVKAFSEGSVGWAAGRGYFEIGGNRVSVRLTAVVHQEDGEWKIVQSHASIGVPNDRMMDPLFLGNA